MASTYDTLESETTFDDSADAASVYVGVDASGVADSESEDPTLALGRKRAMTRSVITAFAAASAVGAALPLPYKGAILLSPIELAEIHALARVYDIPQEESTRKILDSLVQLGIVSMAAHGALGILEKGVKLKVASEIKSAVIATTIVAGIGIGTAYIFEQVYLGKRSANDLGIARKLKKTEGWQRVSKTVTDNLQKVMDKDSIDGLKVFASEMVQTYNPQKVMKKESIDGLKVFASEMSKAFNPLS